MNTEDFDYWWESISSEEREEYVSQCDSLFFEPFDEELEKIKRVYEQQLFDEMD